MTDAAQSQLRQGANPFKAKKTWPPDFSTMSPKHQLRLERRFKRRSTLKWQRPRMMKVLTLAQWGSITAAAAYMILFMDWGQEIRPIQYIRDWFWHEVDMTRRIESSGRPAAENYSSSPTAVNSARR